MCAAAEVGRLLVGRGSLVEGDADVRLLQLLLRRRRVLRVQPQAEHPSSQLLLLLLLPPHLRANHAHDVTLDAPLGNRIADSSHTVLARETKRAETGHLLKNQKLFLVERHVWLRQILQRNIHSTNIMMAS